VSWTAPDSDGGSAITGYVVTPYVGYSPRPSQTFPSTDTTQVVTGLVNGTQYRFRVQAQNAIGVGGFSTASNPVTPAAPMAPGAPTIGTATAGGGTATVSWTAPASDGGSPIRGYVVTPYIGYTSQGPRYFVSSDTTQTVSGLTPGTTYRFRVRAFNAVGVSGFSLASSAVVPTGSVVAIAAGTWQTCALLADGTARCWGANSYGQLGNGSTTRSPVPVMVHGLANATAIDAGGLHVCALLAEGTVSCWGHNSTGQLGDGSLTGSMTPVAVTGIASAVAIAAGPGHTCAVLAEGTVKCWGSNWAGQLGNGTQLSSSVPVSVAGITNAIGVAVGESHSCARLADGGLRCWGANSSGDPFDPPFGQLGDGSSVWAISTPVSVFGMTDAVAIAAGTFHTCAVLTAGWINCWGLRPLGTGGLESSLVPVRVSGITDGSTVGAGYLFTCASLHSGTVACWGYNTYGQLGTGAPTDSRALIPATVHGIADATAVDVGTYHACALRAVGTVMCWGFNGDGELGDGTTTQSGTPVAVVGL
jgi:alpha-tubulin suppressor-like RCC1 family protein